MKKSKSNLDPRLLLRNGHVPGAALERSKHPQSRPSPEEAEIIRRTFKPHGKSVVASHFRMMDIEIELKFQSCYLDRQYEDERGRDMDFALSARLATLRSAEDQIAYLRNLIFDLMLMVGGDIERLPAEVVSALMRKRGKKSKRDLAIEAEIKKRREANPTSTATRIAEDMQRDGFGVNARRVQRYWDL